ncbi:MAG: prepilin-type N-terminal cleavage/methylation domain-containing protein [Proteobacteria bacterium]|nr:prepilin-type N-terminal cleavage/methylation domain-containing protein [Pseudomonadota bacterium]
MTTRRRARGFTLVEVLVALFVMALMAALGWQGVDGVLKSRDISRDAVDRSLLLTALMSQWETDLQMLQADTGVPSALSFDGRTLRLVRRSPDGAVQLVAWQLSERAWLRWASAPTTRLAALQQAWLRSQQLQGAEPEQVRLLDGVDSWQIYFYRGNAWTNAQSTGDFSSSPPTTGGSGAPPRQVELLPTGVRLVLTLDGKTLTRDIMVAPAT